MATNCCGWRNHFAALLFLLSIACTTGQVQASGDGPATLELKRLVAADPEFKRLLVAAIERSKQINPDPITNPAQSLEQYYEFISWAERALPGDLVKVRPQSTLYERLDQSLGYLYYICDQPLDEL
jgi:phosphatidylserine decarboxylase